MLLTRNEFSSLRSGLVLSNGAALMLVVLSLALGFNLGLVSIAMALLGGRVHPLQTSQILAYCDPERYVAGLLQLFSAVALMLWCLIRIFMRVSE